MIRLHFQGGVMSVDDVGASATRVSSNRPRWWPLPFSLAEGVLLQAVLAFVFDENLSYLVFASLFIAWPLIVFQLLLWWTFWSRFAWATRFRGLGVLLTAFVGFVTIFRFDEFDGAMIPRFSLRFRATARDRAEEFFKQRPVAGEASASKVNAVEMPQVESLVPTEQDWPEFRGRNRDDLVSGETLRTDFDARPPKQLWKQPIGLGWGTFSVVGNRAFTSEQRGLQELVVCYEISSGREVWTHNDDVRFESVQGGNGPRATPTIHGDRLFSMGATGVLNCLESGAGKKIWARNILEDAGSTNLPWGQAGSPLIVDDLVIVTPGSNDEPSKSKKSAVIAYRHTTGEKVWSSGDRYGSYASPQLVTLHGEPQVLIFDGVGLMSLAPKTGDLLWQFEWSNTPQINAAQPLLLDESTVLIGSGYNLGAACLVVKNSMPMTWSVNSKWTSKQFKLKFNSAVRLGDFVYGLDEGLLTCVSLTDGQRRWKQGRYGYGQMQLVGEMLLILTEDGDVVLVPATPERPREVARFHAIDGKCWNHPVLNRGRLLLRNSDEAACFDVR